MSSVFRRVSRLFAVFPLLVAGCHTLRHESSPGDSGRSSLAAENADLRLDEKILRAQLDLAYKERAALGAVLEREPTSHEPPAQELAARLDETAKQLTALRAAYARLLADQAHLQTDYSAPSVAGSIDPAAVADAQNRISESERKLTSAIQHFNELQAENHRLHAELDSTLAKKFSQITTQSDAVRSGLTRLQDELDDQRKARAAAEQEADALRAQAKAAADSEKLQSRLDAANARLLNLQQDVSRLETENARIKKDADDDHGKLTTELAETRREKTALEARLALPPPEAAELVETKSRLAKAVASQARLKAENARLQTAAAGEHDQLAAELNRLRQEKTDLESRLAAMSKLTDAVATARRDQAALQAEVNRLKTAVAERDALAVNLDQARQKETELAAQLAQASAASPGLTARLAEAESKLAAAVQAGRTLREKNDRLESAAAREHAELEMLRQQKPPPDLSGQLATAQAGLAAARDRLSQLATENAQLKSAATAAAEKATLESRLAAAPQPSPELTAARHDLSALQAENDRLKTAAAERDTLATDLEKSRQELATLKARLAAASTAQPGLTTQLADTEKKLAAAVQAHEALQQKYDRLETTAAGDQAELDKLHQQKPPPDLSGQLADTRARLTGDDDRLKQLESENAQLKTQAAAAHDQAASELDRLRRQNSDLESRLAAAQQPSPELAAARHDLSALQAENARLKTAAAGRDTLAAELEKTRHEKTALETRLAQAPAETADPAPELADTKRKLADAARAHELLRQKYDQLEHSAEADHAELEQLRGQAANASSGPGLSDQLADTRAKLATAIDRAARLETENARLKAEALMASASAPAPGPDSPARASARIANLEQELQQSRAEVAELSTSIFNLRLRLSQAGPAPATIATAAPPTRPAADAATKPAGPSSPRTHVVVTGDTLTKISLQYYGTPARWPEILQANADVIKNENVIPLGATLRIP